MLSLNQLQGPTSKHLRSSKSVYTDVIRTSFKVKTADRVQRSTSWVVLLSPRSNALCGANQSHWWRRSNETSCAVVVLRWRDWFQHGLLAAPAHQLVLGPVSLSRSESKMGSASLNQRNRCEFTLQTQKQHDDPVIIAYVFYICCSFTSSAAGSIQGCGGTKCFHLLPRIKCSRVKSR